MSREVYRVAPIPGLIFESTIELLIVAVFVATGIVAAADRYLAGAAFALVIAVVPALSIWLRSELSSAAHVRADGAFVFVKPLRRGTAVLPSETLSVSVGRSALGVATRHGAHILIAHERGVERLPLNATSHRVVAALGSRNAGLRLDDSYLSTLPVGT